MKLLLFIIFSIFIISCNSTNDTKQKELELKERELTLKEKELAQKEKSELSQNTVQAVPIEKVQSSGINQLSNVDNLIGNWFMPHSATINIKFNRDGRFEFNDYNSSLEKEEMLTGAFQLENGSLILLYDDRSKQNFRFYKGENGDANYYIKKGEYYFVKGENGN
jgi:hypothetical protein